LDATEGEMRAAMKDAIEEDPEMRELAERLAVLGQFRNGHS
jgi:hypothetical protein